MLVLVGPSASGKTEVANLLINKFGMKRMITYTTRPIRFGEENHVSYHFVSEDEFRELIKKDEFIEYTTYNGYYYGSNKKDAGPDKIVILEPSGANNFFDKMGKDATICFIESSEALRVDRMYHRGDSALQVSSRIENDEKVFKKETLHHIDNIFINENKSLDDLALEIYNFYKERK